MSNESSFTNSVILLTREGMGSADAALQHKLLGVYLNLLLKNETLQFDQPIVAAGRRLKFKNEDNVDWLFIPMAIKTLGRFNIFIGLKSGGNK